jgi:hypothetical protein
MKRKIFNKFFGYMVLAITMLTIAIKIHSLLTFPAITNWNYHQLKKMNEKTDDYSFAVFGDNKNSITTFNELVKKLGDCKSFDTKLVWCHGHKIIPTPCKD